MDRSQEEALQDSERQYRMILEQIDQAFCLLEVLYDEDNEPVDFRLLKTNQAFEKQTGIDQRATGRRQSEALPRLEKHWIEAWCRAARTGQPEKLVAESKLLGRWYDASIFPLEGERSKRIALLFFDITEHYQAEKQLQEADKRKDEFLATLAHELRNPLAAIRTSLDVIKLAPVDPIVQSEVYETVERQSQQLVILVDDLMEVSRIAQGKLKLRKFDIPLSEVLRNALEVTQAQFRDANQTLIVDMPQDDVVVNADPHRLVQIFSNLLDNASKYTQERGRIRLLSHLEGDEVVVIVADNGIGIPRDRQEQIFEMFSQGERVHKGYSGLGLGLTLAKSLVEMHGGTIRADSQGKGLGSSFTIRLPVAAPRQAQAPRVDKDEKLKRVSRVLIVDDNKDAAQMLALVTGMHGCEVKTAHNGEEAVALASQFRPELVLMDLGMPEMDGFEASARIRNLPGGGDMKIVALSGWGQEEDKRRTREAGFDAHLVKPVEFSVLKDLLT